MARARQIYTFKDDGYPEARDYASNYVAAPEVPREPKDEPTQRQSERQSDWSERLVERVLLWWERWMRAGGSSRRRSYSESRAR